MDDEIEVLKDKQAAAHGAMEKAEWARLRKLSLNERGRLIESACEAAAVIHCSRLAAGMPDAERDPWPASTWEFLKREAARVRT
ncbi:MAG: hypothetical protein JXB10_05500 [Pirellulales bacterium]|nr:hypothetical protein [Pirellulales bacterium]